MGRIAAAPLVEMNGFWLDAENRMVAVPSN
jgi:hypothetical protein